MLAENEQTTEEVIEKEIDLAESNQTSTEDTNLTETKNQHKFIPKKNVAELTDADKATIIANYQNGINQPFYDVKQFKIGTYRIVKRKDPQPTVAQRVVNENPTPITKAEKKVYYSDNQLLFEHIIELNAKVDRLMTKHKKLKKKYQALQSDIYVDEDESGDVTEVETRNEQNELKMKQTEAKIDKTEPNVSPTNQPYQTVYPQAAKRGWRSQVRFV